LKPKCRENPQLKTTQVYWFGNIYWLQCAIEAESLDRVQIPDRSNLTQLENGSPPFQYLRNIAVLLPFRPKMASILKGLVWWTVLAHIFGIIFLTHLS